MKKHKAIFESENMLFIHMSELLMDDYLKMYNNQEIQKSIFKKNYSSEQISNWIKKQIIEKSECIFSIIEKMTGEYIGNMEIIPKDNICEMLISITPDKQNRHYGTEAINALLKYVFETLKLDRVELYVYANNLRAIHCYEKAGFAKAGPGITEEDIHMIIAK
ncbi:MAG: GNAT family N-acetyltransferase [Bacilli bacterium]|nr:GNAT family N-acetyltransferase [Bacilli bacterium]